MEISDISAYDSYAAWNSSVNTLIQPEQSDETKKEESTGDGRGQIVDYSA